MFILMTCHRGGCSSPSSLRSLHWCRVTASCRPLLCPDLHWCCVTASFRPLLCPDRARETHVAGGFGRIRHVHSLQTDEVSRSHHPSLGTPRGERPELVNHRPPATVVVFHTGFHPSNTITKLTDHSQWKAHAERL